MLYYIILSYTMFIIALNINTYHCHTVSRTHCPRVMEASIVN